MFDECDLVSQGYGLGNPENWNRIPKDIRQRAEETARDRWMLLFQLDTVEQGDFELMFGDCGLYYLAQSNITESPEHFTAEIRHVTG